MPKTFYLKPAAGLTVRDPADPGHVLPPEGRLVVRSPYWTRRLKDGDVTEASAPKAKGGK